MFRNVCYQCVFLSYVLAIATQIVVFPWFGIETGLAEHLTIGPAFVSVSLVRRLFEAIRVRTDLTEN